MDLILLNTLQELSTKLKGELHFGDMMRIMYATDASEYREMPTAVAYPKNTADIQQLITFALQNKLSLIPRAAGTSLAGQCVGNGIVVDISKHFNRILEINIDQGYAIVEPGVIRDELNLVLKPLGYFFSPITSTANRAMIGGMVGNNSSGTTSIKYGVTRDKIIELETLLSDGSIAIFKELNYDAIRSKIANRTLEGAIYKQIIDSLSEEEFIAEMVKQLPKPSIHRRNTGYAIDSLIDIHSGIYQNSSINLCKLLAGSEGTLAFTTKIKLQIEPLPPSYDVVLAVHFHDLIDSLQATQIVMRHHPYACELMDKIILDCTKSNIEQNKNRWFVEGDPATILMIECRGESIEEAIQNADRIKEDLLSANLGYAYPIIPPERTKGVWQLRSAGLGLLANISTVEKAVACIEDTAVALEDLPRYIQDFETLMKSFGQKCVYYAHAGAGEIHLRPILNLKKSTDVVLFEKITEAVAQLVKKYQGSLSGEHGDGRVRASFIPMMVGEKIYATFEQIKVVWDPNNIFNPGKIVHAKSIGSDLRVIQDKADPVIDTFMDFSSTNGILGMAEKCNGSGDCRKPAILGGTMCPSYQATRDEKDTTRARANVLREYLTRSDKSNPFDHKEIKEVLDLCLSCKGCTSECPSNVDMASLKAEFLHQWHQTHGLPLRSRLFARIDRLNKYGQVFYPFTRFLFSNKSTSRLIKRIMGVAPYRSLPIPNKTSLRSWYKTNYTSLQPISPIKTIYLFCDEFTNRLDSDIGIKSIKLLSKLGYNVKLIDHAESGRAAISKGDLGWARKMADRNVEAFYNLISHDVPLIGIEPSAILSFKDEYPKIVSKNLQDKALSLAVHVHLIDDFLAKEVHAGLITNTQFNSDPKHILLHGHCHQKALSEVQNTVVLLSVPDRYTVEIIPSGCCGMAGSFGYEKEHFELSMNIGSMVLFPTINNAKKETVIAAIGTSCRHQIQDGTNKTAYHPIEILYEALL